MEVETKYIAPTPSVFVKLAEATTLAGLHLEPMRTLNVRDVYFDTPTNTLTRAGYVLRLRLQNGATLATIKSLEESDGAVHRREETEIVLVDGVSIENLPEGDFRSFLESLAPIEDLRSVLELHQQRTPLGAYDGGRLVGVLSLDRVSSVSSEGVDPSLEVEFELSEEGREDDLYRVDPVLRAAGLVPEPRSKFERGVLAAQQETVASLRVLAHEFRQLETYRDRGTPLHRRRARVVLLSADGLKPTTVANKVGLSPGRVEHWVEQFMHRRMDIFADTLEMRSLSLSTSSHPFRVSELVSDIADLPQLFPAAPQKSDSQSVEFDPADWMVEKFRSARVGDGLDGPSELIRDIEIDGPNLDDVPALNPVPDEHQNVISSSGLTPHLTVGEDLSLDTILEEIETAPVVTPKLSQAPSEVRRRTSEKPAAIERAAVLPPRPLLKSADSVHFAAAKVLRYQVARFQLLADQLSNPECPSAIVRKALVTAHRVRISLQLFEGYIPARVGNALIRELGHVARRLNELSDCDHVIAHLSAVQSDEVDDAIGFVAILDELAQKRDRQLAELNQQLRDPAFAKWFNRFDRLVAHLDRVVEDGESAQPHYPDLAGDYLESEADRPVPSLLGHLLGSRLWAAYEGILAYAEAEGVPPEDLLRRLSAACSSLQYVLGMASGCSDVNVRSLSKRLVEFESHQAVSYQAMLSEKAIERSTETSLSTLRARLETVREQVRSETPQFWRRLTSNEYRTSLAQLIASL